MYSLNGFRSYAYFITPIGFSVTNLELLNLVDRRIFPLILVLVVIYGIIMFQIRQFTKLYEHIKNDK